MIGWNLKWVEDVVSFKQASGPKLNYSSKPLPGSFHIMPSGYLVRGAELLDQPLEWKGHWVLYQVKGDIPFDLFAFAFFLISRAEEYNAPRDEHGRFLSSEAWVVKRKKHLSPILDEVVLELVQLLKQKWPELPTPRRRYTHTLTFDIDNGLKYAGRELWRSLGSTARDILHLRLEEVQRRAGVLLRGHADPYELNTTMRRAAVNAGRAVTFFLVGERNTHDHAVDIEHPRMHAKVLDTIAWSEIALHPSYRSMEEHDRIRQEQLKLRKVIEEPVTISRQHFLRFKLPDTYNELIALGIGEDHSMGFSDIVGFRAGTCSPFPWYDLQAERETTLMIHPFAVMDSALCYKMGLSPQEATSLGHLLIANVKSVEGTFESVWHERFIAGLGDETAWDQVFEETVTIANKG